MTRFLDLEELARKIGLDRLSHGRLVTLGVLLAVIAFLAVNVLSTNVFRSSRADLTDNGLFSLSEGTRTLVSKLEEPIHMRLFMSRDLIQQAPQLSAYANRVQSMLETYASLSNGKLALEVIDPRPFSDDEDRAVGLGINRIRLSGSDNELFFGLAATNSTDGTGQIPVFSPDREAFLEYDVTRLIADLSQPTKPVIALIDGIALGGNPMAQMPEQQILTQLRELFTVEELRGDVDKLPDGTRVVLAAHPRNLSERTLYTLDQWVLSGGATLIFVDPFAEAQPGIRPGMPAPNPRSDLKKLFSAWGIDFDVEKAVGDPAYALRTQRLVGGRAVTASNLPWLALREAAFAKDDALLAQLSSLVMTTAGSFKASGSDVTIKPLITGSQDAGLLPTSVASNQEADPRTLLNQLEKPDGPVILAGRIEGKLKSAFEAGKPEGSEAAGAHLKETAGKANVIVVGDADMLTDRNWIRRRQVLGQDFAEPFANNGAFVLNAIEQMAGGTVLADLRGRGVSYRPFERIQALEQKAEAQYLETQQALMRKMQETETRVRELTQSSGKDGELVSEETETALNQFRSELLSTRAQLREVQYNLRSDVERLQSWLTALNVGLLPALFAALALVFALRRSRMALPEREPETTSTTAS